MIIGKAAYFKPCEFCGAHGHFELANGEASRECYSLDHARQVMRDLVGERKITPEEEKFLASNLPTLKTLPPGVRDVSIRLVFCPRLSELTLNELERLGWSLPDEEETDAGPPEETVH